MFPLLLPTGSRRSSTLAAHALLLTSLLISRTEAIGVSQFCPHALERLRFCRRSEYTIEDLDTLRIRTPDTDPKLLQDIENAIKGAEGSDSALPSRENSDPAPSPYADPSSLHTVLPLTEFDGAPSVSHFPTPFATAENLAQEGRGLLGLGHKKRGILNLLNRWILQDERYKRQTSKTARVVGHVAGDLIGLLVSEQFRQMGMMAGSVAKTGVKELATAGIDTIIRGILLQR